MGVEARNCPAWGRDAGLWPGAGTQAFGLGPGAGCRLAPCSGGTMGLRRRSRVLCFHGRRAPWGRASGDDGEGSGVRQARARLTWVTSVKPNASVSGWDERSSGLEPGGLVWSFRSGTVASTACACLRREYRSAHGFGMLRLHGGTAASGGFGSGMVSPAGAAPAQPPVPGPRPRLHQRGPGGPRVGRCAARSPGRASPSVRGPTG